MMQPLPPTPTSHLPAALQPIIEQLLELCSLCHLPVQQQPALLHCGHLIHASCYTRNHAQQCAYGCKATTKAPCKLFLDPVEVVWSILQPHQPEQSDDSGGDEQELTLSQQHDSHQATYTATHQHYSDLQQQHTALQQQIAALEQQLKTYTSELQVVQQSHSKLQDESSRNKTQLLKYTRRYAELQHQCKQGRQQQHAGSESAEWQQLLQAVGSRHTVDEWHQQAEAQVNVDHHTLNDLQSIRQQYHRMVSTVSDGQHQLTTHLRNVETEHQSLQRRLREEDARCSELDAEHEQLQQVSAIEAERQKELEDLLKQLPDATQPSPAGTKTVALTTETSKAASVVSAPSRVLAPAARPFVQSTKHRLAAAFSAMNSMNAKEFQNFSMRQMK